MFQSSSTSMDLDSKRETLDSLSEVIKNIWIIILKCHGNKKKMCNYFLKPLEIKWSNTIGSGSVNMMNMNMLDYWLKTDSVT